MIFSGTYTLNNNKKRIWNYLNDPEILRSCIDGCTEFKEENDNAFVATIRAKIGPVSAKFNAKLMLSDIIEEESYTINGTGNAGMAGKAKGSVKVWLIEENDITKLYYEANTQISGKIAQLGTRLISGSVKKYSDSFFNNFSKIVDKDIKQSNLEIDIGEEPEKKSIPFFVWTSILILIMFLIVYYFVKYNN